MRVLSLASGSKGNAYLVGQGESWLLIDNGLAYRTFSARLKAALSETSPKILGVLVTHSHVDHIGGLSTFLKHFDVPVFANAMTAETVTELAKVDGAAFSCFENGQSFEIGPFCVHPFSIPHDTSDPVGFLVRTEGGTYFHGTDIGTPLDSIGLKLAEADVATLESNHDVVLLRESNRPVSLIQRIAGPRGHLSNDQSAGLVRRFASPRLRRLGLAHLSQDCNAPHLAEGEMRETLCGMNRKDIVLKVYSQDAVVEL